LCEGRGTICCAEGEEAVSEGNEDVLGSEWGEYMCTMWRGMVAGWSCFRNLLDLEQVAAISPFWVRGKISRNGYTIQNKREPFWTNDGDDRIGI
jgi:hypothetical protein